MKLDAVFSVENSKLYKIEDNSPVELSSLNFIQIPWSTVELQDEAYNEEYLAKLRDELKALEAMGKFAVLVPVIDKKLETPEQFELFTNAFNHTARRVKDCVSVAGYELPSPLTAAGFSADSQAQSFIDTIAIKHAQYVYFSKAENTPKNIVKIN